MTLYPLVSEANLKMPQNLPKMMRASVKFIHSAPVSLQTEEQHMHTRLLCLLPLFVTHPHEPVSPSSLRMWVGMDGAQARLKGQ